MSIQPSTIDPYQITKINTSRLFPSIGFPSFAIINAIILPIHFTFMCIFFSLYLRPDSKLVCVLPILSDPNRFRIFAATVRVSSCIIAMFIIPIMCIRTVYFLLFTVHSAVVGIDYLNAFKYTYTRLQVPHCSCICNVYMNKGNNAPN